MHFDEEMGLNLQNLLMKSQDASRKEELTSGESSPAVAKGTRIISLHLSSSQPTFRKML